MQIINGDCLEVMKGFGDNYFDSIVTDPPYGISFMNKHWDYDLPSVEVFKEMFRVIKPGGHILVACGTRTQHRMACNIEDAGFEIRDVVTWLYGMGFPKSLNIGKAIDKIQGNERENISLNPNARNTHGTNPISMQSSPNSKNNFITKGNSDFEGYGTALKPACEFFTLARKPLSEKTVAENVLKWNTGGLNIDECRVEATSEKDLKDIRSERNSNVKPCYKLSNEIDRSDRQHITGRFPANLILDEEAGRMLDEQTGELKSGSGIKNPKNGAKSTFRVSVHQEGTYSIGDKGGASRFFYCAKSSRAERNKGLEGFEAKEQGRGTSRRCLNCGKPIVGLSQTDKCTCDNRQEQHTKMQNFHPTVKPVSLMRYLVRLITPKNGLVLDCFMGSGTTGIACKVEGFSFIGIEREKEYCEIAEARINAWENEDIDVNQLNIFQCLQQKD